MKKEKAKLFIQTPPEPVEVKIHKEVRKRRSEKIWRFLDKRPLIKVGPLAEAAGYSPQNFDKYKRAKETLPQHLLLKVEAILVNYGLNV